MENFRGRGILNHTPVHCGTVLWVKISWFASQPRKPQKFYPPEKYPLYGIHHFNYCLCMTPSRATASWPIWQTQSSVVCMAATYMCVHAHRNVLGYRITHVPQSFAAATSETKARGMYVSVYGLVVHLSRRVWRLLHLRVCR